ncbi:MAG TPA: TolC family protein [Sphingobacteriaceae bacterium]|nr:TolC family protein [Sphingobacteriaceae bacterium]
MNRKTKNMKVGFSARILSLSALLGSMLWMGATQEALAQRLITMETAVREAQDNNLQIKQAAFQASLSEQDLKQARMSFYPTLNLGASGNKSWGLSFDQTAGRLVTQSVTSSGLRLSSGVDLFQGFQRINQVRANKYSLMASESEVERAKNDLTLSVITTYLDALTNLDLYQASQQQLTLSKEQLRVLEINLEAGNNTMADLYQAETQVATDELNVTTSQNAYEMALLNLKQLMEMAPEVEIELERPSVEQVQVNTNRMMARDIFSSAVVSFPEIKTAEFNTLSAERQIAIAKGGLYPSLSLSAGIGTNYSSQARDFNSQQILPFGDQFERNRNESIGLSLNIPIFNQGRTRIGINRAKIAYQNALTNEQLVKNNLNKVIHQAVLDLNSAEKQLAAAETALASATQTFEVIQLRFDEGMANSVELSTSQIAMNRAEFEFIQSKYNFIFRSKVIDFYLGQPTWF